MYFSEEITLTDAAKLLSVSEEDVMRLIQKQILSARWQINDRGERIRLIPRKLVLGLKDDGSYRRTLSGTPTGMQPPGAAVLSVPVSGEAPTPRRREPAWSTPGSEAPGGGSDRADDESVSALPLQLLAQNMATLRELLIALAGQDEERFESLRRRLESMEARLAEIERLLTEGTQRQAEQSSHLRTQGEAVNDLATTLAALTEQSQEMAAALDGLIQHFHDQEERAPLAQLGKLIKRTKGEPAE